MSWEDWRNNIDCNDIAVALTGPPPINNNLRDDAIGGSASNALLCRTVSETQGLDTRYGEPESTMHSRQKPSGSVLVLDKLEKLFRVRLVSYVLGRRSVDYA